jgi:N-acetylmuramoyl-L-alanine amidase
MKHTDNSYNSCRPLGATLRGLGGRSPSAAGQPCAVQAAGPLQRRQALTWLGGAAAVLALPACSTLSTTPGGVPIDLRYNAKGQDSRVLFLVLHYTVADLPISIKVLTERDVSAHYLLTDEIPARILRLVPEERRAWHSGPSAWKGHRLLNASSIGIEIVHPGFKLAPLPADAPPGTPRQRVYQPFPQVQMDALIPLVRDIVTRHQIRPDRILGHGEVSPQFKQDPGPTFPWARLAQLGITPPLPDAARVAARQLAYEQNLPDAAWFQAQLGEHGYAIEATGRWDTQTQNVMMNFQMRYRPARYDGAPDAETAGLLWVLNSPANGTLINTARNAADDTATDVTTASTTRTPRAANSTAAAAGPPP